MSRKLQQILTALIAFVAVLVPTQAQAADVPRSDGYWIVDSAGAIHSYGGAAEYAPVVGTPVDMVSGDDGALWVLSENGVVHTRGIARNFGDVDVTLLDEGEFLSGIAVTASEAGYWVTTNRGRVIAFGDAERFGGLGAISLDGDVVDIVMAANGVGHYLVGADGGVFAQGGVPFLGSRRSALPGVSLHNDVVAAVPDSDGLGYWVIASDGGLFAFDAAFVGSVPLVLEGRHIDAPIVEAVAYGSGVLMLGQDGGVFVFSDLPFHGSAKGRSESPAVAVAVSNPRPEITSDSLRLISTLELGAGAWQPARGHGRLWVPNRDEDTLTVIDAGTFEVIDVIAVGDRPFPAREAWGWIWVPNVGDGTVSVIDPVSLETVATIATGPEPRTPQAMDFKVFVAHNASPIVTVINGFTLEVIDEIEVAEGSQAALVDYDDNLLWVPNTGGSTLTVINSRTHDEVNRVAVGAAPFSPTKAYGKVWVPNRDSQTITVVEPGTYHQIATIDVGMKPSRPLAAFGKLFVGGVDSSDLLILDPLDYSIERVTMEAGALMPAVGRDAIWVANPTANKVTVVDPVDFDVIATLEVDGRPRRPVIDEDYLFISTVEGALYIYEIR